MSFTKVNWSKYLSLGCCAVILAIVPIAIDPVNITLRVFLLPKLAILHFFTAVGLAIFLFQKNIFAESLKRKNFPKHILWLVVVCIVWLTVTTVLGVYPMRSWMGSYLWQLGLLTRFALLGVACLVFLSVRGIHEAKFLARIIVVGSVVLLIYGIAQYLNLDPITWAPWGDTGPVISTLGNENSFGAYLALMLPITLTLLLIPRQIIIWRVLLVLLIVAQVFCLITTNGVGAVIAAVVSCSLVLWWHWNFNWRLALAVLLTASIISIVATVVVASQGDILGETIRGITTREVRSLTWESAYRAVAARPMMGWGSSSFDLTLAEYASPGFRQYVFPMDRIMDRTHNLWLEMAVETGLTGSVLWLALAYSIVYSILRSAAQQEKIETQKMLLGGVAALFGYIVYQVVNPNDIGTITIFYGLLGWTLGLSFQQELVEANDTKPILSLAKANFAIRFLLVFTVLGAGYELWQWFAVH